MTDDRTSSHAAPQTIVAYTTDDDRYAAVRLAAIQHARGDGCAVVLFDADAASSISEPMPNQWGSEGEGRGLGDRLNPEELEFLGRGQLATQVREARAGGIEAFGWLPKDQGLGALADYAIKQGAHQVFVPDDLKSIGELDGRGIRIERVRSGIPSS